MPSLVPELSVLKPIDPSIANSDDYEIFTLANAAVYYENGRQKGKHASLLAAYADTPLRVRGTLEAMERGQAKYLVQRPFKPADIEIRNVTRFSYGQMQDGEIAIWALGEAGWFELVPNRAYSHIFQDMVEAIECLYFVTDIHSEAPRKRGGGPSTQLIFREYAEDERFAASDIEEAEKIFEKHRVFLMICFLNKAQDVGWASTPLYQYFKKRFSKDWDTARARVEGKSANNEEKSSKTGPVTTKSKERGKMKTEDKTSETPKKDDSWWQAAAIFEFMQKAVNQGVMHVGKVTLDRLSKLIVQGFEVEEIETARNAVLAHASNLCYIIDHPKRKSAQFFASEPIYEELSAEHNLPAAVVRQAESIELRRRKDHGRLKEDLTASESESGSSQDITTPQRRPSRRRGRISILRPKSSKYSGTSKGKGIKGRSGKGKGKGKAPNVIIEISSSSDEEMVDAKASDSEIESENDEPMDTPTQGLLPGKRKHAEDVGDMNPRKRAASESLSTERSPSSPPASSPEPDVSNEALLLRWRSNDTASKSTNATLLPPLVSSPLPTYAANGPGGSWICSFDGCSHKIYGVGSELGRRLVKEHLQDHAKGTNQVVGIVLREEEKCRLPVSNLLKRIREMSERQQPLFPSMGPAGAPMRPSPQPIERVV